MTEGLAMAAAQKLISLRSLCCGMLVAAVV